MPSASPRIQNLSTRARAESSKRKSSGSDPLVSERTLGFFGSPSHYREFVESGRDEEPVSLFERAKAGLVLGGEAFVSRRYETA